MINVSVEMVEIIMMITIYMLLNIYPWYIQRCSVSI